jgi:hypothetical protein
MSQTFRWRGYVKFSLVMALLLISVQSQGKGLKEIYDSCVDSGFRTWPSITNCGRDEVKRIARKSGVTWCEVLGSENCQLMLLGEGLARLVDDGEMTTEQAAHSFLRVHAGGQSPKSNRSSQQTRRQPNWNALIELGNQISSGQAGFGAPQANIQAPPMYTNGGYLEKEYVVDNFTKVCVYGTQSRARSEVIQRNAGCASSKNFP